jgi:cystathionine beta-lyase
MDFAAPPAVTAALTTRAQHPVYGYTFYPESLYQALISWFQQQHNWHIERDSILMSSGVVTSLHAIILALTQVGDGIIIQPPVYPPFFSCVTTTNANYYLIHYV